MELYTQLSPEHVYLHLPPYSRLVWKADKTFTLAETIYFQGTLDCYCVSCGKQSTFGSNNPPLPKELSRTHAKLQRRLEKSMVPTQGGGGGSRKPTPRIPNDIYKCLFTCSRNESHTLHFWLLIAENEEGQYMQKIGQYPSFGDLNLPELRKYSRILSKDSYGDLVRGVGLASHDVGIGAFVYVRRVFERLVEEAHQTQAKDPHWKEEEYESARMSERIKMLAPRLPSFMAENAKLYGLLSKGIHELSEQECLSHFELVRLSIESILDQKIELKERQDKQKAASRALSDISGRKDDS